MPVVKIELCEGHDKKSLTLLKDTVMEAVVAALQIPADDRNIRVIEYAPEYFQMKPPYEMLIEISLFAGRTKATKKRLYTAIVDKLYEMCSIEKSHVFIILYEISGENWGIRGGVPADEIEPGFKLNV